MVQYFKSVMSVKSWTKGVLRQLGYEISRADKVGKDPFADMAKLLPGAGVIFDVGANTGQSAKRFRESFPRAEIHSFEPSPSTFAQLQLVAASDPQIHVWNCGLGAAAGRQLLQEYEGRSDLNSCLPPGSDLWARPVTVTEVEMRTVDCFRAEQLIPRIDILKSDTQGYDFNVLQGAMHSLQTGVGLVYMEVNFARLYESQGSFGKQYDLLTSLGFRLFSFYQMFRTNGLAGWTDALFIHRSLLPVSDDH